MVPALNSFLIIFGSVKDLWHMLRQVLNHTYDFNLMTLFLLTSACLLVIYVVDFVKRKRK